MNTAGRDISPHCPLPLSKHAEIQMAHGSGGKKMHQLIDEIFLPAFSGISLKDCHDSAVLEYPFKKIAFTTDSYVVNPLFFPGGDIGMLAVNGTVNDLAMSGAKPLYLSVGFILEEGLPLETLTRITQSIKTSARQAQIEIVTGDTKVVDKGKGDGMFINTAGIGVIEHDLSIAASSVKAGDVILISGDIGRHGMAVMAVRAGLEFESAIESDTRSVARDVLNLIHDGVDVHCLRDLTRGGLASALNEIAVSSGLTLDVDESLIPVREDVASACEILGLDPLYVANEGRFIAFVPEDQKDQALRILNASDSGSKAAEIGIVSKDQSPVVFLKSQIGATRILDMLSGDQLPRIC